MKYKVSDSPFMRAISVNYIGNHLFTRVKRVECTCLSNLEGISMTF